MFLSISAVLCGLWLLLWSADKFVDGAAGTARHFGMPPLLIGMVVVGFGTSAPEIVVSTLASLQGNPGIALGNAYGSNITNIALILGITAIVSPIAVQSRILRTELPVLSAVSLLAIWMLRDGNLSRMDAAMLLLVFGGLLIWTIRSGLRDRNDAFGNEMEQSLDARPAPIRKALFRLCIGLILLIVSSRILVWGAVTIAHAFGAGDLVIGLTIVAIGTSLPELASSIIAARKGEHDICLGNVIGSNLFNTLAVVGIAGLIHPTPVEREIVHRDMLFMTALTISLFIIGYGFGRQGRINRIEGAVLLFCYGGYLTYLLVALFQTATA
ncbi:calcium/sodium antiporter [Pseudodesulfovibrio tunisiensis]|uniref:calcium/sodium antiporter n=1 Tax=Pseudodesulfovibrio tunisiensis TaxID=463192 RepID=UPI001FB29FAE|nr:calcium/sodium antiporter [Pseudodesulfovibrio tunisiensis]